MKINFITIILLSLICSNYCFSQDLDKTTNWLEEAIKSHIIGKIRVKNIEIYPCRISWTTEESLSGKYGKTSITYEFNPSEGQWISYNLGIKNTKENIIKIIHFSGETGEINIGYQSDFFVYKAKEDNLADDLIKALNHIATYCD